MKKIKRMTCGLLPLLAGAAVLIEHYTVPNAQAVSGTLPVFIGILMCGVLILTLLSIQSSSVLNWLRDRSAWYITWQRGWGNFTKMYTAIVMICITFLFVDAALGLLRRRILRWEENADA